MTTIRYNLSEHPSIITFTWSSSQSFGSTWSFLFVSISIYILLSFTLHILLSLFYRTRNRTRIISLGPIPALHSLVVAVVSLVICTCILLSSISEFRVTRWFWRRSKTTPLQWLLCFLLGILLSSIAEIRDTRWFCRRSKTTPLQWLLCFPLGTRPSGRVFFWSYVYYLSRFLHVIRTFFLIITHRKLPFHHLINHSVLIFTSFMWLEFSQSFQVLAIVFTSLVSSVVYGYRFWIAVGLPTACFPFVLNCHIVLLGCNLVIHVGVLLMHVLKGRCNGIGAWGFNSAILLLFLDFYVKRYYVQKNKARFQKEKEI